MYGNPVVRGTRVPVDLVLRKLDVGVSPAAILVDPPRLTLDDILAAQAFAAFVSSGAKSVEAHFAKAMGFARRLHQSYVLRSDGAWRVQKRRACGADSATWSFVIVH